ncbi:endonuclease/exonuclease/phosphatase family protein [Halomicrobium salinisoli]|uniref:endonuclease/exonuclease/phosphatase family protein n=1 Tax=Halomicrobium salinisoli TaxID=2878391 RepID=UPI001CF03302|nr:endonuclease/exonuclease/phosphatase family protein [Halomicrobium salinisoli]
MPSRFDVMTYNVRYDNPKDTEYVWRKRRDEVASVVRFHGPDVLGLQEALHDQVDDLRERLPRYEWLYAGRDGDVESAGEYAAIAYDRGRFNLEAEGTFWLSETPDEPGSVGWDAMLPRLVKWVRLREIDTGIEFVHYNTHFDHAGAEARCESAALLRDRIDGISPRDPVIVTGDFNTRESEVPYDRMTTAADCERTLLDAHYAANHDHHGPETTVTDFTSLVPGKRIDYVFVTPEVEIDLHGACSDTYGDGDYPSDHLPVITTLSLPRRTADRRG